MFEQKKVLIESQLYASLNVGAEKRAFEAP